MPLHIFARFHAQAGRESDVEAAIREVLPQTAAEAGCLDIHAYRAPRDPRLFYIHSMWRDEAVFEHHAGLPHTIRFIDRVEKLIDHSLDVARTEEIA